ncbi:uncharacterized protein [Mytilus edulis]|uniref:uncharacterized protein n=1 Tax=Mytilus edulis TaxID=6550 RepID=UPI0039F0BDAB
MNNQNDLQSLSCKMYHYLSDFVVGSEKVVKYRRYFYKCFDDCLNTDKLRVISSGSKAEGLDLPGSDLDLMCLLNLFVEENNENTNTNTNSMCLDTENASSGFACIKIPHGYGLENISDKNISITNTGSGLFLTNDFGKQNMSKTMSKQMSTFNDLSKRRFPVTYTIQGPAFSTSLQGFYNYDFVFCISCRAWPSVAKRWLYRSRSHEWPSFELITMAIDEGVLLVPVGSKSNSTEDNSLEWRFSFSLVEKLLVHSFNHCQLLCYALLKIFLKEIIDNVDIFNKVLCSYYMKTILFWVLEEVDHTYWTQVNLLRCFLLCMQRLHYFIGCNYIPNYFIPKHNMIDGRMSEQLRKKLEVYIAELLVGDLWNALLSSSSLNDLRYNLCNISKPLNGISEFDKTLMIIDLPDVELFSFVVKRSLSFFVYRIRNEHCPSHLKNIYAMALLDLCKCLATSVKKLSVDSVSKCSSNKQYYSQYKQCLFYLLLNLNSDAVSGWLLLGKFFYSCQEYDKMSEVLLLSEKILTLELYDLPCLGYVPTLKQINCKTSIQSKPFLKRLRHTFIKTPVFYKGKHNDDSFVFHKDLTHSGWRVVHFGSQEVHLRYLVFLKLYKQKHTDRMDSALMLLKEAVGRTSRSNVSSVINYSYLLKAQLLIGDDDYLTTIRGLFSILHSFGLKGPWFS